MANTLAYYDTATITAVKSFIVQVPGVNFMSCQISLSPIPSANANNFFVADGVAK